ncbi:GTP-Rho binding exocyst subunit [Ophidiomyces ophidiicola]|nr:GTP-Rho binding exocyst subunit [Ophidiomyces ophidiicola]KAI1984605.1 GTP-Rho binding exocyst subunit [Ophidiomyces ophidiicola]KAI1999440.1 GTP-Rho binding exocyst subunit [Ophidiomyces ophidiicola]
MSNRDRLHGLPAGLSPQKSRRPGGEIRNGGNLAPGTSAMSRAEKFEDEKQRIIQSCFSKKEPDGSVIESYITHIRVMEDGSYPSSPPPPDSSPDTKKPRIIIIAVRKSGRVRMHKARENDNHSFSIGKTWMLDDLARIQTYENSVPSNPVEQQQKQWASNVGFIVTITKPYYWQSDTPKERDFFIGSLVKIYKKYTGGKLPALVGFDSRDREILTGGASSGSQSVKIPKQPEMNAARQDQRLPGSRSPSALANPTQSPLSNRAPSRDGPMEPRRQPSREPFMRNQPSQEQMQRMRVPFATPQVLQTSPSKEALSSKTIESPFSEYAPTTSFTNESASRKHLAPISTDGTTKVQSPGEGFGLPRSISSEDQGSLRDRNRRNLDPESASPLEPLKQRVFPQAGRRDGSPGLLRPSTAGSKASSGSRSPRTEMDEMTAAPIANSAPSRELPPSRGSNVSNESNIIPTLPPVSTTAFEVGFESSMPNADTDTSRRQPPAEPAPLQVEIKKDPSPPPEEETHRPGLGPMVKKKASKDVANTFRKAATAYSVFKPRAGGAAERLMAAKEKSGNEPDGITSVVPAPFSRMQSSEVVKDTPSKEPAETQGRFKSQPKATPPKTKRAERATRKKPPASPVPRPEPREDNSAIYCNSLGIDHNVLQGRGAKFDQILTDLGWDGKLKDDKRAEDFEADIRREIGRVQASSWLGHLEFREGQANELGQLFDQTIQECEELDALLTLYSHELSTLADDVTFIESQADGLQVRVSNQKLLQMELQNVLAPARF